MLAEWFDFQCDIFSKEKGRVTFTESESCQSDKDLIGRKLLNDFDISTALGFGCDVICLKTNENLDEMRHNQARNESPQQHLSIRNTIVHSLYLAIERFHSNQSFLIAVIQHKSN